MKLKYEGKLLAAYMKAQRLVDKQNDISISLGSAAKQTGISKPTLSRLEKGGMPDALTLAVICKWIDKPMDLFFTQIKSKKKL